MAKTSSAKNGKAKAAPKKRARVKVQASRDKFGFRVGSLKSKAAAMYASKNGATLAEVKAALHSPQFNLLTELKDRRVKIKTTLVPGEGTRKVTRYQIVAP